MRYFPAAFENLTEQFARLPGIGSKTAQRLAFHVLGLPDQEAEDFAQAMKALPHIALRLPVDVLSFQV